MTVCFICERSDLCLERLVVCFYVLVKSVWLNARSYIRSKLHCCSTLMWCSKKLIRIISFTVKLIIFSYQGCSDLSAR